jgi:hypothetical protein
VEADCCGTEDEVHCPSDEICTAEGTCQFVCIDLGEECSDEGRFGCCDRLTCIDSTCQPICAEEGANCDTSEGIAILCCEGLACNSEGVCEEIVSAECEVDADCVTAAAGDVDAAICCAGVCRQIECCIDDILTGADPNARCPEGSSCFEGICVFACKGDADCESGTCCCADGTCSSDCCETGGVTELPNTGIRDGDGGGNALLGAALAAGAAAYLAGKKLKGGAEEA